MNLRKLCVIGASLVMMAGQSFAEVSSKDFSLEDKYKQAIEFSIQEDFESALRVFVEIREWVEDFSGPNQTLANLDFDIGNCLIQLERYAEAKESFKRCFLLTASEEDKKRVLSAISEEP